jgi:hypothetical protein
MQKNSSGGSDLSCRKSARVGHFSSSVDTRAGRGLPRRHRGALRTATNDHHQQPGLFGMERRLPQQTAGCGHTLSIGSCTVPTRSCWTARVTGQLAGMFPLAEATHKHVTRRGRPSDNHTQ